MIKRRVKWWWIAAPALLAAAIFAGMYLSPKIILSSALSELISQLKDRFEDDPLLILLRSADPEGKYTIDLVMKGEGNISGPVTYDVVAQTDGAEHRFFSDGSIRTSEKSVPLSLYVDGNFVAMASSALAEDSYYGITYDSFASDIRKISLLSPFVSDEVLAKWSDSLKSLQARVCRDYPTVTAPEISLEEDQIKTIALGIAALPCTCERVSTPIGEETLSCKKLDYTMKGAQLNAFLSEMLGITDSKDREVSISFYICDKSVVKILFQYWEDDQQISGELTCGKNPDVDDLTLLYTLEEADVENTFSLTVSTRRGESLRSERWILSRAEGESSGSYEWSPATGAMRLTVGDMTEAAAFYLAQTEDGIRIITSDMGPLVQAVLQDDMLAESFRGNQCTMDIQTGSQIEVPTYKNIDTWSLRDLLILLNGIGNLLGVTTS